MQPSSHAGPVDVCIVVEGCYPFVTGGVSTWLDWLIRTQPETTFGAVAITADEKPREPSLPLPSNLAFLQVLPLSRVPDRPRWTEPDLDVDRLTDILCAVLTEGDADAFDELVAVTAAPVGRVAGSGNRNIWARRFLWAQDPAPPTYSELLGSRRLWQVMTACYSRLAPNASFPDFFWAWRNLVGSLFAVLTAPIPAARSCHAISTGYAGLFAARAAVVTGRPAAITEHGIYTNERRIDLITADWITDTIRAGLMGDDRTDIRGFWIDCFESYARIAYAKATRITTLYRANQAFQTVLGAAENKLRVIPNGIQLDRFDTLPPAPMPRRPTAALLGRVVPIKDVKAYIAAAARVKQAIPDVLALVMGPTDEDPDYYEQCRRMVADLGLEDTVRFTGKVDILQALPTIDVMVLTSISEAQPLVLLEAGAARIPCVTTDVGSCREIIEGTPDEEPRLGAAGRVVAPMAVEEIADAVIDLLTDDDLRRRCGNALRRRVEARFTSEASARRYAELYGELTAA